MSGIWKQGFGVFLYIQIFTNILLCFFSICNSQEFGTKTGRCLEVDHEQNFPKDQVRMKPRDQELFTKES